MPNYLKYKNIFFSFRLRPDPWKIPARNIGREREGEERGERDRIIDSVYIIQVRYGRNLFLAVSIALIHELVQGEPAIHQNPWTRLTLVRLLQSLSYSHTNEQNH